MGLFKEKKYIDSYINQYYKGTNCFSYSNGNLKFALNITGKVPGVNSTDFYKCILHCSDKKIYNNIVAGINLEEMKNSSEYTRFVFEHVFNESNIKDLNKSYYLGSAFVQNGSFTFIRDERAYKKYYTPEYLRYLALIADLHDTQNQLKNTNKSSHVKIKRR